MKKIVLSAFADEAGASLAEQIAALHDNKISLIELRGVGGRNISEISSREAAEIGATLRSEGISLSALGSPMGKVSIRVDIEQYLDEVRRMCEITRILGCDRIRMFSFFDSHAERERVIDYLCRMVGAAESYGVGLYHENEKGIYGDTAERVLDLHASVEGLRFVYDPANFLQVGESADKTLAAVFPISDYFHVKDVISEGGILVPAGMGDGEIPRLVSMIEGERIMTVEPHLAVFEGYDKIDGEKLRHKFKFESKRHAFDVAVEAIKNILVSEGYEEREGGFERC